MISKTNTTIFSDSEAVEYQKYIGLASVNVLAVNPDAKTLNNFGFTVTEEPEYLRTYTDDDGTEHKYMNLRLLCSISELEDNPIISLYFRLRNEPVISGDGKKAMVIDNYGNAAWLPKDVIKSKELPENVAKKMDSNFKLCHGGEASLAAFLHRYLVVPPYEKYDKALQAYVLNKDRGELYFDNWKKICEGDVSELREYFKMRPDNHVRVILGIGTTDENKTFQTFIGDASIWNNPFIYYSTNSARSKMLADRTIESYKNGGYHDNMEFSSDIVKPYVEKPTEVNKTAVDEIDEIFPGDDIDKLPFDAD